MHLYFHVPFCARRCSYCDFAIAVRREVPSEAYADAVLREWEIRKIGEAATEWPVVETIYFGGGTPSLLSIPALARILDRVRTQCAVAPGAEVTLEANPDDVTLAAPSQWRGVGVTRVSLGAQSFDPEVLRWMHRTHRSEQVAAAMDSLRGGGIPEISLDLIFGLPAELGRDWSADLAGALALGPEHLSLYGLTVENHTPLAHWLARGENAPVDEGRYAAEFLAADQTLGAAGFEHYEVSNYARAGHQARHNAAYWRRAGYLGLGPSAHSGSRRRRRWNLREWAGYQRAVARGEDPIAGEETLDEAAERLERLYLGLRTSAGLPAEAMAGAPLSQWEAAGWVEALAAADRVRLTPEGWLRMDALVAAVPPPPARSPV